MAQCRADSAKVVVGQRLLAVTLVGERRVACSSLGALSAYEAYLKTI